MMRQDIEAVSYLFLGHGVVQKKALVAFILRVVVVSNFLKIEVFCSLYLVKSCHSRDVEIVVQSWLTILQEILGVVVEVTCKKANEDYKLHELGDFSASDPSLDGVESDHLGNAGESSGTSGAVCVSHRRLRVNLHSFLIHI